MSTRKFCALQCLVAVLLIVSLLANTYAWSDRTPGEVVEGEDPRYGSKLSLEYDSALNYTTTTAETYRIYTLSEGDGATVEEMLSENAVYTVNEGDVLRFKTVVKNSSDDEVTANISLLLRGVTFSPGVVDDSAVCFTTRIPEITREFTVYYGENYPVNGWIRILPSCEITVTSTAVFEFEWTIEFAVGGEFTIGEVILEHF